MLTQLSITNYLSLMSFATINWTKDDGTEYPDTNSDNKRAWLNDLATLVSSVNPTTHQITSVLSLLSAAVKEGTALPPYIQSKLRETSCSVSGYRR